MEWSKIKNIVLLILAAVNVILLGLVFQRRQQVRRYEEELRTSTLAVLADKSIAVEEDLIPWEESYTMQTVTRSVEAEEELARKMLGECELVDTSPYTYESGTGSAWFRSNGEYQLQYSGASPFGQAETGEEAAHAQTVLSQLGLDAEVTGVETNSEGTTWVTVRQLWSERPLFDCTSRLEYQDGTLRQIAGKRMFGTPEDTGSATLSAAALLIDFMELVVKGEVCNQILAVETGYTMTTTLHEAAVLTPVWYITTDTGVFELDAMSGTSKRLT